MDNRPAENALPNLSATAVAPGSWAYVRRGQPSEDTNEQNYGVDLSLRTHERKARRGGRGAENIIK